MVVTYCKMSQKGNWRSRNLQELVVGDHGTKGSLGMSWDYVDGFAVNPIYINTVIYTSKFREVLFICPICVYGPILLAGGVNMRLRCIKKKIVRHERILGNLTTHVRKTHLPTFTMNAGNHRKKIVHVARSIFCVICVFNVFWVAGTLICVFSVK